MNEFVKTETGWKLCWGGAALYATKTVPAPRPVVIQVAAPLQVPSEPEPTKVLSA